jgi:competence protein CoiA
MPEAVRQEAATERARRAAEQRRLAAEDRRQATEEQAHEEQGAEQERLSAFFEHAGMQAALRPAFMQLVRSASGKAVVCGNQSPAHGNGLLLCSRPREASAFQLAGGVPLCLGARPVACGPDRPGARSGLAVAYRGSRPESAESRCAYERVGPRTGTLT